MNRPKLLVLFLVSWGLTVAPAGLALASGGDLDTTFGADGKVTTNFTKWFDFARGVALQTDGKIVAVGRVGFAGRKFGLVRYNTDGTRDSAFGGDGRVTTNFTDGTDVPSGVAIQTDGKIVAAGGADGTFALARYKPGGTLDPTFGGDGKVTTDFRRGREGAVGVAVQANGKIVAAGGSDRGFAVARYKPDGRLDPTFSGNGKVVASFGRFEFSALAHGMALQTDNKIVVAGEAARAGDGRFALARFNADGTLDSTFSGNGKLTTDLTDGFDVALCKRTE
jgi:uncharacterized delta-60 repeat protein